MAKNGSFFYKPGAGPLLDIGPYYVTALVSLLGPARRCVAMAKRTFDSRVTESEPNKGKVIDVEVDTHVTGSIEFANGALATRVASFDVWDSELPRMEIYGTKGTICIRDIDPVDGPNLFGGVVLVRDVDKLVEIIRDVNQVGRLVSGIRLNSIGGNLLEGAKIADAIRTARIVTVVTSGSTCASACFLAFAAGSEKYVAYSARVGVHGASDATGNETPGSDAATVAMARAVKALGVPAPIVGKMVVTPPSEIVWLSVDDLRSMGTTMVGKPNQTTAATTAPPNQIAPPIPTAPSVHAEAPTWQTITDKAAAISTQQNNGKIDFRRTCQAELKACTLSIWYKNNDGKAEMVRSTQDSDERVLERDICSFNEFLDVRTCVNFDTHVVTKEMFDANKSWTIIETSH